MSPEPDCKVKVGVVIMPEVCVMVPVPLAVSARLVLALRAVPMLMLVALNDAGEPFSSIVVEPELDASVSVEVGLVTFIPVPPDSVADILASPPDTPCKRAVLMLTLAPLVTV